MLSGPVALFVEVLDKICACTVFVHVLQTIHLRTKMCQSYNKQRTIELLCCTINFLIFELH